MIGPNFGRLVGALALAFALPTAALASAAGFRTFTVKDPISGKAMDAFAFYPTNAPGTIAQVGAYSVDATPGAPIGDGKFPVVVFSHGAASTPWIAHDLASSLAAQGFIFAGVTHAGDNLQDHSAAASDRAFIGREYQISALIDAVLADPVLAPHADLARIAAAGYSAGAYTALLLAGAKPNFALHESYCKTYPADKLMCSGWRMAFSNPPLQPRTDARVRAVFAEAPFGAFFDAASLRDVKVPIDIWAAGDDRVLPLQENAGRIKDLLPGKPAYHTVAHADHFVFMAPCPEALARAAAQYCTDAPGIDRAAIHRQIAQDALAFFRRSLRLQ